MEQNYYVAEDKDFYSELYNLNYGNMTTYKTGYMFGDII